ncbi:MAG TPA: hypothetical protein VK132_10580 [Gemmatimonadales bacterium]|nr:hypothetical protein [Gemmatimonadales bacterium]
MTEEQAKVREYHERFGCTAHDRPTWAGAEEHRVRVALIEEELAEFRNAGETHDLVEIADSLADLLYVVYGAAVAYGIDLQPVFDEIHAANLSKGEPEVVRRPDGMLLKGAGYRPPQVARVVREQLGLTAAAS